MQTRELTGRRGRQAPAPVSSGPAYVTRKIPYYAFLDEEALSRIEDQAFHLLETVGIEFREAPDALARWRQAGAEVNGTRVRADRGLVRSLLASAPAEFEQRARNPARSVRIGGPHGVGNRVGPTDGEVLSWHSILQSRVARSSTARVRRRSVLTWA